MATRPKLDLIGKRFDRLTAIEFVYPESQNRGLWRCQCDCGETVLVKRTLLINGNYKSCGCWRRERGRRQLKTHGMSNSSEFATWKSMIARCHNKNDCGFFRYGGRGIQVCDRWRHSFHNFYSDMGPRPSKHHCIDRINNDLGYSPENCRWTTPTINSRNRRNNRKINHNGITLTVIEWAERLGIPYHRIWRRLHRGQPIGTVLDPRDLRDIR